MNAIQNRKERERAARESLLLEHAARLLVRDGFQDLNLDELAAAVEYSKGTLYLHFKSKEDLVLGVATQALKHRADLLERAGAFAGKTRERVRAMAFACGEFMATHRDYFTLELMLQARSFWDRVSDERRNRHLAETARIFHAVNQVVLDARACGDLPRRSSPEEVALSLMAITMGSHCMITLPALQTVCPLKDPAAALLEFGERLMDGWGWKPISNGNHSDVLDKRIQKQLSSKTSESKP
ncbi:MAG: TetR/AcrR family transcriptional regulator [Chthoniobacter sp.]|nr:TetR/AcrR family transcriptional regulator [Chthoniobacter sp.]